MLFDYNAIRKQQRKTSLKISNTVPWKFEKKIHDNFHLKFHPHL